MIKCQILHRLKKIVVYRDPSYREYRSLPIFPNQEGDFKRYEELHIDEVAEELKCVFEGLGGKIRDRLLDPAFNNICPSTIKKYTSKSIFDDINSYLYPSDDYGGSYFNFNDEFLPHVLRLITYIPEGDANSAELNKRLELIERVKDFYQEIPTKEVVYGFQGGSWYICMDWLVRFTCKELAGVKNTKNLSVRLEMSEDETIDWLDAFCIFLINYKGVDGDLRWILNNSAILPSQSGVFQKENSLYRDDGIPQDLKEIIYLVNPAWLGSLLDFRMIAYEKLISEAKVKDVRKAAEAIDDVIEEKSRNMNKDIAKALNMLRVIFEGDEVGSPKLFRHSYPIRDRLWLRVLEGNKDAVIACSDLDNCQTSCRVS